MASRLENAHALIIGIAKYEYIHCLPSSVINDARDIFGALSDKNLCAFPQENVHILLDRKATRSGILKELNNLAINSDKDSIVWIYISGHGGRIESGKYSEEYFLPVNAKMVSYQSLVRSTISGNQLSDCLSKIKAHKLVVFFDCCHAGGLGTIKDPTSIKSGFSENYLQILSNGNGRVIIASSRDNESSWIMDNAENSLFTHYLLEGLGGKAADNEGYIRIFDIFQYVKDRVVKDQPHQHPVLKAEVEDNFPIALLNLENIPLSSAQSNVTSKSQPSRTLKEDSRDTYHNDLRNSSGPIAIGPGSRAIQFNQQNHQVICRKCNKTYNDQTKYCPDCGCLLTPLS